MLRVCSGLRSDSHVQNAVQRTKERIGQPRRPRVEMTAIDESWGGDIGAVAKLRETRAGDVLAEKDTPIRFPPLDLPAPVSAFAYEVQGRRGEGGDRDSTALGGGSDAGRSPRPRDGRADHRRTEPDPRRGDRRPDEADEAGASFTRRGFRTSRRSASRRPTAATRSRPAAASSATATSRSSPSRRGRGSSSSTRSRAA